jgi:hypothetical protein
MKKYVLGAIGTIIALAFIIYLFIDLDTAQFIGIVFIIFLLCTILDV